MPRRLRNASGGYVYHVLNRAVGRGEIFADDADYQAFERIIERTHNRIPMRIVSYCLMPNLLTVCRYVERNAVRANLAESAWKWPWCSLRRRSGSKPPAWLLPMKRWPAEPDRDWTAWVNRPETSAELESLHASVKRGRPYGSPGWQSDTAARLELQSTLRARGRPRIRPAKAIKDSRPL